MQPCPGDRSSSFAGDGRRATPLYGTTETGGITIATDIAGEDVDGRVGRPMAGVEVKVQSRG